MESLWPYKGSPPHQHIQAILHSYQMSNWDKADDLYWELIELVRATIDHTGGTRAFAGLPPDDLHGWTDQIEEIRR